MVRITLASSVVIQGYLKMLAELFLARSNALLAGISLHRHLNQIRFFSRCWHLQQNNRFCCLPAGSMIRHPGNVSVQLFVADDIPYFYKKQ
jgi:hypothetical protein